MEPLYNSPKLLLSFGIFSGLITVIQIVCIFLPYWMHIDSTRWIGVFHSINENGDKFVETGCTDSMGELECSYLKSFQISAVVSVMFGGVTTLLYFFSPNYLNDMISFFAITGTLIQASFGLITFVLFYYFEQSYFDDDGINQEYPGVGADETNLAVGWYLWLSFNSVSWIMVFAGYFLIYKGGSQKKGVLRM